ncbi:MAG TPA: translation initiation factor IF-2 [Myxococcota bacterium]|jgi:translation initiation factor IF-2
MAKIRAYKLAEELGIDRNEFVERAAAAGVPLKSAMASLDEAEVEKLRKKLGGARPAADAVTEQRVGGDTGSAVIRRRKKAAPEPVVEPVAPPPVVPQAAPPPVASEPAPPPSAAAPPPSVAIPEPEPIPEPIAAAEAAPEPLIPQEPVESDEKRGRATGTGRAATAAAESAERAAKERKRVREVVNLREQENLARQATSRSVARRPMTLEPRATASPRRRRRDAPATSKAPAPGAVREEKRVVRIDGSATVGELARMLGVKAAAVQRELMKLGTMVGIHQTIDLETARTVGAEFGFELQDVAFREQDYLEDARPAETAPARVTRPPIITVMGHVDHGKTSLLDAIRKTDVVAGEAGGITQHIGAYQVTIGEKKLTFIDTPGHAAFTAMRARGAQLTDIVVLVVAATEGVMPQTVEAIDHARSAGVPIVVAVNKCDLPGANPQQTRQRLMEHGLVPEDFGGETICVNVSATKGTGLDQLLEMLALQADVLELRCDPSRRAVGVVIESQLDKGRGPVATVLVRDGTLRRGDMVVIGTTFGRVRAMEDQKGQRLDEALPSMPVQVIGLSGVPEAGAPLHAVESERVAKDIIDHRVSSRRAPPEEARTALSLEEFFGQAESGGVKELPILVKADVHGSVEALREALLKLSTDAVKVNVVHSGVGAVTETDVMLAKATGAIVVAFHVRPEPAARRAAEAQGVDIRAYQIIYEVSDEVRKAMTGLLPPTVTEVFLGRAEVRATFSVPRIGTIAGCYITEGLIRRGGMARLLRDGVQIYEGKISSLKRFKDDAREVASGFECGIGIEGFNDVKIGDVIESYVREERAATLE